MKNQILAVITIFGFIIVIGGIIFCVLFYDCFTPTRFSIDGNTVCHDGIFVTCKEETIKRNKEKCILKATDINKMLDTKEYAENIRLCHLRSTQSGERQTVQNYTISFKLPLKPTDISIEGGNEKFKECVKEEIEKWDYGCYGYGTNETFTKSWAF